MEFITTGNMFLLSRGLKQMEVFVFCLGRARNVLEGHSSNESPREKLACFGGACTSLCWAVGSLGMSDRRLGGF